MLAALRHYAVELLAAFRRAACGVPLEACLAYLL
jgi:hypothetical protein